MINPFTKTARRNSDGLYFFRQVCLQLVLFLFFLLFPVLCGIIAAPPHTLSAGGDMMKITTLMGFGVGMATTLIAAKAMSSGDMKSRGKAIRKKIVQMLD